jgi:pyrroline-5-carboxylate reductase
MLHTRYGAPAVLRGVGKKDGITFTAIRLSSTYAAKERGTMSTPTTETRSLAKASPLSAMPFGMFMRSLLVATISSKKWLLVPSLHLLDFFAKPDRTYLFNLDKNPVLKAIIKKSFYDQFCAGTTPAETKTCVKALKDLGFRGVILTYAQEMVFDHKSGNGYSPGAAAEQTHEEGAGVKIDNVIESWRAGTVGTIDLIEEGDILAIK